MWIPVFLGSVRCLHFTMLINTCISNINSRLSNKLVIIPKISLLLVSKSQHDDNIVCTSPQVLAVMSVRRVSMATLQGAPVCSDPAGPASVTATLTSAWREAAIAAAVNVWGVWTTRRDAAVRPVSEVSTTAEPPTPANVRTTFQSGCSWCCVLLFSNLK